MNKLLKASLAVLLGLTLVGCSNNESKKIDGVDYTEWKADLENYGGNQYLYQFALIKKDEKNGGVQGSGAYTEVSDDKITSFTVVRALGTNDISSVLKIDSKDVKKDNDFIKGDNSQFRQVDHYFYNKIMGLATGIKDFDLEKQDTYEKEGKMNKSKDYGISFLNSAYGIAKDKDSQMLVGVKVDIDKALAHIQEEGMQDVLRYLHLLGAYDETGNCFYYSKLLSGEYKKSDDVFLINVDFTKRIKDVNKDEIFVGSYRGEQQDEIILENRTDGSLSNWMHSDKLVD